MADITVDESVAVAQPTDPDTLAYASTGSAEPLVMQSQPHRAGPPTMTDNGGGPAFDGPGLMIAQVATTRMPRFGPDGEVVRDANGHVIYDIVNAGPRRNPYMQRLMDMKEDGLAHQLFSDKRSLFEFTGDNAFGVLQDVVRGTVRVEHKGDWFNEIFIKVHTTPVLKEVTEAMYEVYLYRKEDMIRHTGIRFRSEKAGKSFLFDVQSFGIDRSYTPIFREEPEKPFKYKPIGHVYLSRGLLSLLSQIKSQKYGRTNNCRDGFMATIVICQFWNSCLGLPQALQIDKVLDFIRETIKEDHKYFDKFCCGYTDKKAEERRKEIQEMTDQLTLGSGYDASLEKMRKLNIIENADVPPLFVLHDVEHAIANEDTGMALPPPDPSSYNPEADGGQPIAVAGQ